MGRHSCWNAAAGRLEAAYTLSAKPGAAPSADDVDDAARTFKIQRIEIDGNVATVDYSARSSGRTVRLTQQARKIDGDWQLVDVSN